MTNLLSFNNSNGGTPGKSSYKTDKVFNEALYHQACGHGVDQLLIKGMKAQSLDNLSIVMIGLKGFYNSLEKAYNLRYAVG